MTKETQFTIWVMRTCGFEPYHFEIKVKWLVDCAVVSLNEVAFRRKDQTKMFTVFNECYQ